MFSIVIPTYHRKESLLRLLRTLEKKSEIIVVEQGDNNGLAYKKYVNKYIYLTRKSTPRAMNIGVENARNDIILFLDDDTTAHKHLIKYHLMNFSDPRVAATVGRVLTVGQPIEKSRSDTGRVNMFGLFSNGYSSVIKQEVDTVIGANTCWRKSVYEKLGGMDERFTGNAIRLESDLSLRAKNAGYKIIFEPKAIVDHHRAPMGGARKNEGRIEWYFNFFSNETYFFLKHRLWILLPIMLCTRLNWILRCMFGFGREVSWRSMITPFYGIINGVIKYYDYRR